MKFFMRLKLPLVSSMTSPRSMSQAVGRQKRSKRNKRISCVTFLKRGQGVGARKNRRREGFRRREKKTTGSGSSERVGNGRNRGKERNNP